MLAEQQPLMGNGAPLFEWSPGVAIDDGEEIIIQDGADAVKFIEDQNIEFIEEENQGAGGGPHTTNQNLSMNH